MLRTGLQRLRTAPWFSALCAGLLALISFPGTASALTPDPASNFPEQIATVCAAAPQSVQCTQAGIAELDEARASDGQDPYRLPPNFLQLSGAHQIVVLTNLDRQANGLRAVPGTTAALDRTALEGAQDGTDPVVKNPQISWAANWAGGFPSAVWAYLTWMYDDGYGGPNIDCTSLGDPGCWGHRHDILAQFPPGGTLEMGAADLDDGSYAMIIAEGAPQAQIHYDYRSPTL